MDTDQNPIKRRVLALPNAGGKLAIANALLILVIVWLGRNGYFRSGFSEVVVMCVCVFLTSPLALPFLSPSLAPPTTNEIILQSVAIGITSFIWGYGLAWLGAKLVRRKSRVESTGKESEHDETITFPPGEAE